MSRESSLIFDMLCCERYFFIYKHFINRETNWIEDLLKDIWNMISDNKFVFNPDVTKETIDYLTELYEHHGVVGADFLISLIDVIYFAQNIKSKSVPPLNAANYLIGDLGGVVAFKKFGKDGIYESTSEWLQEVERDPLICTERNTQKLSSELLSIENNFTEEIKIRYSYNPIVGLHL
jgi:hypothetical protein